MLDLAEKILNLRRKRWSYNRIAVELDIAKSTVGYWIAQNPESQAIKMQLTERNRLRSKKRIRKLIAFQKKRWADYHERAIVEAEKEFPRLIKDPLFTAGLMLYWGEGDRKSKSSFRLTNTDPRMIGLFMNFLRSVMKISEERLRCELILYPDLSDSICREFWSEITQITQNHFMKTQFIQGRHPTARLSHGICMIIISSTWQKTKMMTWIDIFAKTFTIKRSEKRV